jgi:tetratricopeptide (TPR) repeat protein
MPARIVWSRWLGGAVLVCSLTGLVRAEELSDFGKTLVAAVREELQIDAALFDVKLSSVVERPRRFVPGTEVVLVCPGLADERRNEVETRFVELARSFPGGDKWLANNAVIVSTVPPGVEVRGQDKQMVERLISALQHDLELSSETRGAVVREIRFAPLKNGQIALQLSGQIVARSQHDLVEAAVAERLSADPEWQRERHRLVISTELLTLKQTNPAAARRYFQEAVESFKKGQYADADKWFSYAIAEAPADELYPLWKIVTAVALDDVERAKQRLMVHLRHNPNGGFRSRLVAPHFERVQGPLREKVHKLEREVLADLAEPLP